MLTKKSLLSVWGKLEPGMKTSTLGGGLIPRFPHNSLGTRLTMGKPTLPSLLFSPQRFSTSHF